MFVTSVVLYQIFPEVSVKKLECLVYLSASSSSTSVLNLYICVKDEDSELRKQ